MLSFIETLRRRSNLRAGRIQWPHAHVICGALLPGQEPVGDDHANEQTAVRRQRRVFDGQGISLCLPDYSDEYARLRSRRTTMQRPDLCH